MIWLWLSPVYWLPPPCPTSSTKSESSAAVSILTHLPVRVTCDVKTEGSIVFPVQIAIIKDHFKPRNKIKTYLQGQTAYLWKIHILTLFSVDWCVSQHGLDLHNLTSSRSPIHEISVGFECTPQQTKSHLSRQLKSNLCWHTNQCGAQCEAAFNTDLIVSALSKQQQHMRLKPHEAECVQSTELCPDNDTQDEWRKGGGIEGRRERREDKGKKRGWKG